MVYNQQTELESQSTISSENDDINWALLGPIAGTAAAFVIATLIIIVIVYCYHNSNRDIYEIFGNE